MIDAQALLEGPKFNVVLATAAEYTKAEEHDGAKVVQLLPFLPCHPLRISLRYRNH
jgi:hypothetical protein